MIANNTLERFINEKGQKVTKFGENISTDYVLLTETELGTECGRYENGKLLEKFLMNKLLVEIFNGL